MKGVRRSVSVLGTDAHLVRIQAVWQRIARVSFFLIGEACQTVRKSISFCPDLVTRPEEESLRAGLLGTPPRPRHGGRFLRSNYRRGREISP